MDGPNLFRELIKRGEVHDATDKASTPQAARSFMKAAYPKATDVFQTGHDTAAEINALGSMSGDTSNQGEDDTMDHVVVDATTFDEKVRQLVQSAGAQYNYKAAEKAGLAKRIDPELLGAVQRLQKNAGFLNKLVRKTNLRRARQGKPPVGSGEH